MIVQSDSIKIKEFYSSKESIKIKEKQVLSLVIVTHKPTKAHIQNA